MHTQTNYMNYDYLHACVRLHFAGGQMEVRAPSLNSYLNGLCQQAGSCLKTARQVYTRRMRQRKYIPVLIQLQPPLLFLPSTSVKTDSLCYVNFARIAAIEEDKEKNRCIITFVDGLQLKTENYRRMERNYLNAEWYLARLYSSQSSQ